jgi:peptidoglycan/LPS O-acetylase OafA/YrhL
MKQVTRLAESKPHYEILDGLRGVAAVVVVFFHIFEIHSGGDHAKQIINHGYMAVDFFFILSGFVIGYAYDDRWGTMSLKDFFKRRLIRLQPMIVAGSIIGGLLFYFQDAPGLGWGDIHEVPVYKMLAMMLIGCTLLPAGKGLDIRGWNEMHPLNGPAWSLFFEYIANIIYALILRRVSKAVLGILVAVAAAFTIQYALTNPNGDIIGGWSIDDAAQLRTGFIRLAFPFLAGLLLSRIGKLKFTGHAFLSASILLVAVLSVPRLGGSDRLWLNGLYECFCIMLVFPLIVWLGAGGKAGGKKASKICKFFGDISYPVYITHFPLVCIYYAWVVNGKHTLEESWLYGLMTIAIAIVIAYGVMRFLDLPVREWLRKRFL